MKKIISFRFILFDLIKLLTVPLGLLWFRPKLIYMDKTKKIKPYGGAILISNHITFFDPVFLMVAIWFRRFHFLAMQSFFSSKFLNFLFTYAFMCLPVDRDNFSMKSFKTIVSHLKQDELIAIFPEGHINREEENFLQFKSGMILMSMQSQKPIIPVYIKKRKTIFSRLVLAIGEPIVVSNETILNKEQIDSYTKQLYETELKLKQLCEPICPSEKSN